MSVVCLTVESMLDMCVSIWHVTRESSRVTPSRAGVGTRSASHSASKGRFWFFSGFWFSPPSPLSEVMPHAIVRVPRVPIAVGAEAWSEQTCVVYLRIDLVVLAQRLPVRSSTQSMYVCTYVPPHVQAMDEAAALAVRRPTARVAGGEVLGRLARSWWVAGCCPKACEAHANVSTSVRLADHVVAIIGALLRAGEQGDRHDPALPYHWAGSLSSC